VESPHVLHILSQISALLELLGAGGPSPAVTVIAIGSPARSVEGLGRLDLGVGVAEDRWRPGAELAFTSEIEHVSAFAAERRASKAASDSRPRTWARN